MSAARVNPRIKIDAPVNVLVTSRLGACWASLDDVSIEGLRLTFSTGAPELGPEEPISLQVYLTEDPVVVEAQVRHRTSRRLGVVALPASRAALKGLVRGFKSLTMEARSCFIDPVTPYQLNVHGVLTRKLHGDLMYFVRGHKIRQIDLSGVLAADLDGAILLRLAERQYGVRLDNCSARLKATLAELDSLRAH